MKPLISIIVPIYNVENYLQECIESLLIQTYRNLEILLIDDGSTDLSGNICDEYANRDSRISIVHKENGGLSDARNAGLKAASGEYYMFIDSDDYISQNLVEKMYLSVIQNNCDIAICNMIRVFEDGTTEPFYQPGHNVDVLLGDKRFDTLNQPSVCNKLFRSELFNDLFFPKGKFYEDTFVYHVLAYRARNIVLTGEDGYWYRSRKDSILGQPKYTDRYFDFVEAVWQRVNFLLNHNVQPYADEACLSLYVAYSNAKHFIVKTASNKNKFIVAKKQYLEAYRRLLYGRKTNNGLKQKIRLVLLRYIPKLHKKLYWGRL